VLTRRRTRGITASSGRTVRSAPSARAT